MIRSRVLSVGSSQLWDPGLLPGPFSGPQVYGGSAEVGKPVELVISGWLESEKKEALF